MKRTPLLLVVLALASLCTGCVAVAAAGVVGVVGAVQYHRNEVEHDFPTPLQETWDATLESLETLDIEPTKTELGVTEGVILKDELVIRVERHPEGFTRVRVRVGTFHSADHERRAQIVLQEIEETIQRDDELRAWAEKVNAPAQPSTPPR